MRYKEDQYDKFSDRMHERFPKMFEGKYGGFAVGPGWWTMLETLCETIQNHIDQSKGQCSQVVIEQIKEKFGTLRFYYSGGDDFVSGAVYLVENLTNHSCEECGAPGHRVSGGWVKTLCEFHIAEREAMRAEEMRKSGLEE